MAIGCVIRKTTGVLKDKDVYYVEPTTYSLIDSEALLQYVEQNFQTHSGQVLAAVSAVVRQMIVFLQIGHRVQVPGLGTFALKMKGKVEPDGEGVLQLKEAKYTGIQFTPDKVFARILHKTTFTLVSHNVHANYTQIDDDQAMAIARDLCNTYGGFLVQDFGSRVGCSYGYARKVLNGLVNTGRLVKHSRQYSLPQQP